MRFKDLRLGHKLAILLGFVLVVMAGVKVVLVYEMNVLKEEINTITSNWLPSAIAIANINSKTSDLRITQLQHAFARDDSTKSRLELKMVELIEDIEKNQEDFDSVITTSEQRDLYLSFEEIWERYQDLGFEFVTLSRNNENEKAAALLNGEAQRVFNDFSAILEELVSTNQAASFEAAQRAERKYNNTRRGSNLLMIATVIVVLVLATLLVRLITVPVKQLAKGAENVAAGNIDIELEVIANDEIGDLSRSFNQMTASLRGARDKIRANQKTLKEANRLLGIKNRDLEDALRQLEEAQQQLVLREKMASLGALVAGVAHEINNPVGAVKSAADTSARSINIVKESLSKYAALSQLARDDRFLTALEVLQENNDITVTASDRIAEIVRSLKNFARLDEADFKQADIHEGLDSTLTLLHHETKNRIEIRKNYGSLPHVFCYPNQLNQVFMNVLINAAQAIQGHGVITIETRVVSGGKAIVVAISDSGKGIPADKLPNIFDPGFTTKGVGVGTGLGLSISYNIIKKHRGKIEARSKPGEGTTIVITLPVEQPAGPATG